MKIVLTEDMDEVKKVLYHPEIYPEIKGNAPDDFELPTKGVIYLAGYDPELIGIACFHSYMDGLKYHPNVLPEHRGKSNEFIKRTLSNLVVPVYVEVPEVLEKLCIFHGFKAVDRNEKILMRLGA